MARRRPTIARLAALAFALALPLACNVFVSLDQCGSDDDCRSGTVCDPVGRYCTRIADDGAPPDAGPDTDAGPPFDGGSDADADAARCDLTKPFSITSLVRGLEDTSILSARFTPNERTVLLSLVNPASASADIDLFSASRADGDASFALSGPIPTVNAVGPAEFWPTLSADGKLLFFESSRSLDKVDGSYVSDQARVWSATRVTIGADFDEPRIQATFVLEAGSAAEGSPYLHPGGRALYFISYARPGHGQSDIFVALLDEVGLVTAVKNIDVINTAASEIAPVVSLDDTTLYFAREDTASPTFARDIWVTTRATPSGAFGAPSRVEALATTYDEFPSWVSDDRCRLYFISDRPTGIPGGADAGTAEAYRLWVAERPETR